jgi:anti-sigma regulatory factor (Ser/Thr protein kinase)
MGVVPHVAKPGSCFANFGASFFAEHPDRRRARIVAVGPGGGWRLTLRDWGSGENPAQHLAEPYDPLTPGGLGMVCLRKLMDKVVFAPQVDGMLLSLEKRR